MSAPASGLSSVAEIFARAGIKVQPARPAPVSADLYAASVGRLRAELHACAHAAELLRNPHVPSADRSFLTDCLAKKLCSLESEVALAVQAAFGLET